MTTAAQQYRALVAKLEEINDPRSQEERDSQMANFKGAYKDWEDSEAEKAKAKPAAAPNAQPSPVSGDVKKIQTLLNQKGAQLAVDGRLGANTLAAIVKHLESETGTKPQQWTIDGEKVPQTATSPAGTVPTPAKTTAQGMAAGALDPWAKGGLFNR